MRFFTNLTPFKFPLINNLKILSFPETYSTLLRLLPALIVPMLILNNNLTERQFHPHLALHLN